MAELTPGVQLAAVIDKLADAERDVAELRAMRDMLITRIGQEETMTYEELSHVTGLSVPQIGKIMREAGITRYRPRSQP